MATYERKEIVEAVEWSKVGDHAKVEALSISMAKDKEICNACGKPWNAHGMIPLDGVHHHTVCPGQMILTHDDGRIEQMDAKTFQARYSLLKE